MIFPMDRDLYSFEFITNSRSEQVIKVTYKRDTLFQWWIFIHYNKEGLNYTNDRNFKLPQEAQDFCNRLIKMKVFS
jgi:hypothetical protein